MNRLRSVFYSLALVALTAGPALADSGDLGRVNNFINNLIQALLGIAGVLAAGFFVWGGIQYITSSGSPLQLDKAKQTLLYSVIGLAVAIGAFVLTGVVTDIANGAFK